MKNKKKYLIFCWFLPLYLLSATRITKHDKNKLIQWEMNGIIVSLDTRKLFCWCNKKHLQCEKKHQKKDQGKMGLASLNMTKYHDKLCPEGQTAFVNIKKKKTFKEIDSLALQDGLCRLELHQSQRTLQSCTKNKDNSFCFVFLVAIALLVLPKRFSLEKF